LLYDYICGCYGPYYIQHNRDRKCADDEPDERPVEKIEHEDGQAQHIDQAVEKGETVQHEQQFNHECQQQDHQG